MLSGGQGEGGWWVGGKEGGKRGGRTGREGRLEGGRLEYKEVIRIEGVHIFECWKVSP